MNIVSLMGRLTRDPDIKWSQGQQPICVARYTLAVDRDGKKAEGKPSADFISCVAFGNKGEFAEKYLAKGTQIGIVGHIQTGSYTNKEGKKVYTTDIVVDRHYFCGSKADNAQAGAPAASAMEPADDIPEEWADADFPEELTFS